MVSQVQVVRQVIMSGQDVKPKVIQWTDCQPSGDWRSWGLFGVGEAAGTVGSRHFSNAAVSGERQACLVRPSRHNRGCIDLP